MNTNKYSRIILKSGNWMVPLFASGLFDLSVPIVRVESVTQIYTGFGFISKINSYMVRIMWRNSDNDVQYAFIGIGDLDHKYYWLSMMCYGSEYQICFQYTLDHNITDIKLCGMCCRISKNSDGKFGFIKHAIFYENLYFRFECVDYSIKSDNKSNNISNNISIGDWVAFRVGKRYKSGTDRYWATHVYKL